MILLAIEQALNGLQLGITLFLMSAGLTLTFGIMRVINLAHGSLYMVGAYVTAYVSLHSGSFTAGLLAALLIMFALGFLLESTIVRPLYRRGHLDQVLATFALVLIFNGSIGWFFGRQPLQIEVPTPLSGAVHFTSNFSYPIYRLTIIGVGAVIASLLFFLIARTRFGMLVRAGSTHRELVSALGVNLPMLFSLVFSLGAVLAGFAGGIIGPIQAVEVGMGDQMVILAFVVIVIGGLGSVRGAMVASVLVGIVDALGRSLVPQLLKTFADPTVAASIGVGISATSVYVLMAIVLLIRPSGLFHGRV
jgi:branched-chain amino acid transport system permease protein